MQVLHVEDDREFAELTVAFLDRLLDDVAVDHVADAEDALARLAADEYDCVISDYDMPGRDGITLLEAIRERDPDLPVILLTGKGSEEVASEAISAGVTDYVQKGPPERFELLANRITVAVSQYETHQFERATKQDPEALLERISDAFFALDEDWRFTYVNRAAAASFDATPDDLLDDVIWERYPEATETTLPDQYRNAVTAGEPRSIEVFHEAAGRWHREHLYPARDGLAVISEDITEQKESEERLWMLYEFHEAIIDSANVWITVLDPDGNVVIWNEAAEEITGYAADDVVGDDAVWDRLFPTDDRRERSGRLGRAVLAGETTVRDFEVDIETADGERRRVSWSARAIPNRDGDILGAVGFARDVTGRYERERTLADHAERLERFSVAFPDIALIIDEDYRYADYLGGRENEDLFLIDPDDFLGQRVPDVLPTVVAETQTAAIDDVLEDSGERTIEYHLSIGGTDRWFEGRVAPLAHAVGGKRAVILVARDITERRERERALERERNRFRTLFESLPTPVVHGVMRDGEPVIEQVNQAFADTFGSSPASLVGEPLDALTVPEESADEAAALNRRALEEGGFSTQVTRETVDGPRDFVLTTVIEETAAGRAEGYAFYTDITDRG